MKGSNMDIDKNTIEYVVKQLWEYIILPIMGFMATIIKNLYDSVGDLKHQVTTNKDRLDKLEEDLDDLKKIFIKKGLKDND